MTDFLPGPGPLRDEEIRLVLSYTTDANPQKQYLPAYYFLIIRSSDEKMVGSCTLRVGQNESVLYSGHIGYAITPEYRGHHYAAKACKLLMKLAKRCGLAWIVITCVPDNEASRRTCLWAGGDFEGIFPIPKWHEMYQSGRTEICRYRFSLTQSNEEIEKQEETPMLVKDVYDFLDQMAPFSYAMDFDNCGLLVGGENAPVKKILVALDCTAEVLKHAKQIGASLIVTHHPLIFHPIKSVKAGSLPYELAASGISILCAHTNLDLARGGVNDALAKKLGLKCLEGLTPIVCTGPDGAEVTEYLGRVSFLPEPMEPDAFAQFVKDRLSASLRYVSGGRLVRRVAVCGGSGTRCLDDAAKTDADALVTSEVDHDVFLKAEELGITLIDAGHFHTEDVVVEPLCQALQNAFPEIQTAPYHLNSIKVL